MPSNSREALVHFRKTLRRHEAGDAAGTRALAFCYLTGHGIDQSIERAVAILKTLKEDYYNGSDYLPIRLDKAGFSAASIIPDRQLFNKLKNPD